MTSAVSPDSRTIGEAIVADLLLWSGPMPRPQDMAHHLCAALGVPPDARVADLHVLREGQHVVEFRPLRFGDSYWRHSDWRIVGSVTATTSVPFPVVVRSSSSRVDVKGDK